jgi:penicillin-binding protein 2
VIAMVVENAGFGAEVAAPIARKALDYYLLGKRPAEKETTKVPKEDAVMLAPVEEPLDEEAAAAATEAKRVPAPPAPAPVPAAPAQPAAPPPVQRPPQKKQ